MAANDALLEKVGPWHVGQETPDGEEITRIELRTDGHGLSGLYDMIYIYTDPERPWAAMPAHNTDFWEYKKPLPF